MSQTRLSRLHKATALVPVALLSCAWTASLATASAETTDQVGTEGLVPTLAVQEPASVSMPDEYISAVPAQDIATAASAAGIPENALAAYQRAATVLAGADPACGLDWTLLAAIGRVESNHGRFGGNVLDASGVATPGIFGIPLDGTSGTALITDTDAGQYDADPVFDRAVGPMQFIPTTWSVVGVDGDGDGLRNPQDIDDAALATGVYLCSGTESLTTTEGLHDAIFRYNNSEDYVSLVLAIMGAYGTGNYTAVPNYAATEINWSGAFDEAVFEPSKPGNHGGKGNGSTDGSGAGDGGSGSDGTGTGPTDDPKDPVKEVVETVTGLPGTVGEVVTELDKATAYCTEQLTSNDLDVAGNLPSCIDAYLEGGANAVDALLGDLLDLLGLGGLLP
jgi:hypothetical protein